MTKSRGINKPAMRWTPGALRVLTDLYPDVPAGDISALLGCHRESVYAKAFELGLKKTPAALQAMAAEQSARARTDPRLRANQFRKGLVPWNKGVPGINYEGCRATQFKHGERRGAASRNWVPIGTHRIADGYLQVKVRDVGHGAKNFEFVHRVLWVQAHGAIPPGHIVVFKTGMFTNRLDALTLDRLELITRAEHARRNHPRNKSPELARLVQLKGAITRQVNRITREAQGETNHV